MLEGLRVAQNTWIGKAIMAMVVGLIVIAFSIFGIGDIFRGFSSLDVADVGSIKVTTHAFQQAYRLELEAFQQQQRRAVTNAEAHLYGIDSQVLSRLVSEAVLDDRTIHLGLAISDQQIAQAVRSDPAYAGPDGRFERSKFDRELRNSGLNEQSFVREQRQTYLRQELIQALIGGLELPAAGIEVLHRYEGETRSLDYVTLPASAAGDIPPPDEPTLRTYFEGQAKSFAAPQFRKLVVLSLTPSNLAKPDAVSDADARQLYDRVKDQRFGTPERRHLQQLLLPNEAEAAAVSARISAGLSFADLLAERKLSDKDIDLGTLPKSAIFDPAVAEAAFALPLNGVSSPVKSTFGAVIIHVAGIEPAGSKPFADVAEALKREIATSRTKPVIESLRKTIEDLRTNGKTLAEAATSAEVPVRVVDAVDATGNDKSGQKVKDLPNETALLKAAFASDVGVDNDILQSRDGGVTWFEVAGVEPARPRSLDEVKSDVEAAWHAEEVTKRLAAKAQELVKAIDGGETLEQVAASFGHLPISHVADAKRAGAKGLAPEVVANVFDLPVGAAGTVATGDKSSLVFKVLDSIVPPLDPDAPQIKTLQTNYRAALAQDILSTYIGRVSARIGTKINQAAFQASVGAGS